MSTFEAFLLGLIQGLTEFLPVSSSGHLELANYLFGIEGESNLQFTMVLHGATVLSTIVVFWSEIIRLIKGVFKFKLNPETVFVIYLLVSLLPILFVGIFFKDLIEGLFGGNLLFVGIMLMVTSCLLTFSHFAKPRNRELNMKSAFIIGLAQAVAVLPGLSRSGATISTGILLGIKREDLAKFSFLMVLIPIIGMNLLELGQLPRGEGMGTVNYLVGFLTAFVSGALACKLMIRLVCRGKLLWFAIYCAIIGICAIIFGLA